MQPVIGIGHYMNNCLRRTFAIVFTEGSLAENIEDINHDVILNNCI